ncbi:hypothetical protein E2C01_098450 [Portunus trituberculatus]|uniref:Uncharacterized protein n=1 Tax=Portunus trituberculatus TaxID=210409 RepID=A0A5B7KE86_PORTR|nr:hypothetical protein [Portunus trituberculatus]
MLAGVLQEFMEPLSRLRHAQHQRTRIHLCSVLAQHPHARTCQYLASKAHLCNMKYYMRLLGTSSISTKFKASRSVRKHVQGRDAKL